jgi:hypothetical protein
LLANAATAPVSAAVDFSDAKIPRRAIVENSGRRRIALPRKTLKLHELNCHRRGCLRQAARV